MTRPEASVAWGAGCTSTPLQLPLPTLGSHFSRPGQAGIFPRLPAELLAAELELSPLRAPAVALWGHLLP